MTLDRGPRAIVADASAAVSFLQRDPTWLDRWAVWAKESAIVLAPAQPPIGGSERTAAQRATAGHRRDHRLALDPEAELATLDRDLAAAAEAEGIALVL